MKFVVEWNEIVRCRAIIEADSLDEARELGYEIARTYDEDLAVIEQIESDFEASSLDVVPDECPSKEAGDGE